MTELNSAKFLANLVILCFDRQYPEQNTFVRWKSEYWPPNIVGWLRYCL